MATNPVLYEEINVRNSEPQDVPACARICFEAFAGIADRHNFPRDFPSSEAAESFLSMIFSHPGFYAAVAEVDGEISGSICMDERSAIFGIGPLTIAPRAQDRGLGCQLMEAVLDRVAERGAPGVRLVQAAYHSRSMALYAKLGFCVREPLVVMQGRPLKIVISGYHVRPASVADLEACNRLCQRVHGYDRGDELRDAIRQGKAMVTRRANRVTAYATTIGFTGHAVAETVEDLQAIIAAAGEFSGPGFLMPVRNTALFGWCLERGLRVVQPMTLMTLGLYNEPAGAFLPSILS
jgi:predicted N-acetyltransferase YhbS